MRSCYIGIDVQIRRNCCYAVIDDTGTLTDSGWLANAVVDVGELIQQQAVTFQVHVGIDAPRMPLNSKRRWYWNGSKQRWEKRYSQKGYGRHCEIVISAHRIANPQWTPLHREAPPWMNLGFKLYDAIQNLAATHEVFPSASYALLYQNSNVRVNIDFSACKPGPKDMLDAWVAAATVREFVKGRGFEVGGGDGFGTIVLPRPIPEPVIEPVLHWPGKGCES